MKQILDASIAAAAGKALIRLGSMRKQLIVNNTAEWVTPWVAGEAVKARMHEGQRRTEKSSEIMTREPEEYRRNSPPLRVWPGFDKQATRRKRAACAMQRPRLLLGPKLLKATRRSSEVLLLPPAP